MSDEVEIWIETWGGDAESAELVISIPEYATAYLPLKELKAALDAIPES